MPSSLVTGQTARISGFADRVVFLAAPWLSLSSGADNMQMNEHDCDPTKLHLQNKQCDGFHAQAIIWQHPIKGGNHTVILLGL